MKRIRRESETLIMDSLIKKYSSHLLAVKEKAQKYIHQDDEVQALKEDKSKPNKDLETR